MYACGKLQPPGRHLSLRSRHHLARIRTPAERWWCHRSRHHSARIRTPAEPWLPTGHSFFLLCQARSGMPPSPAAPTLCRGPHLNKSGALCHSPERCPQHRRDAESRTYKVLELFAISPKDARITDAMQRSALKQFWSSSPFPRKMFASPTRCRGPHL